MLDTSTDVRQYRRSASPCFDSLTGHLTRAQLEQAIAEATPLRLTPSPEGMIAIVDCLSMTDYDLDARHAFVQWLRTARPKRVAILTERQLWRMVIGAMAMASSVPLRWFASEAEAQPWLESGGS